MHNKNYKKAIVFALVLTMLMPLGSMAASSTSDEADSQAVAAGEDQGAEASASSDGEADEEDSKNDKDELPDPITDEDAVKSSKEIASNNNFIMYADEENERIGLYVKSSGKYWCCLLYTSPSPRDTR